MISILYLHFNKFALFCNQTFLRFLSIINYQLSIINYQLSIINYQLSIINYNLHCDFSSGQCV